MTSKNFVHNFNIYRVRHRHCLLPLIVVVVCYYRPVSTCCTPSYRPSTGGTAHGARTANWGARAAHSAFPFARRTQRSPVRWHGCCHMHSLKNFTRWKCVPATLEKKRRHVSIGLTEVDGRNVRTVHSTHLFVSRETTASPPVCGADKGETLPAAESWQSRHCCCSTVFHSPPGSYSCSARPIAQFVGAFHKESGGGVRLTRNRVPLLLPLSV